MADAWNSQSTGALLGGGTTPMPAENWPVMVVKGEIDPAYTYGVVRFGGLNAALYGKPVNLAGKITAVGEAIDPYAWPEIVPTGRKVKAVAYFNETSFGRYALEGIPAGIYTIKASCAGYPEDAEWEITLGPGQSYSHDFYLTPGAVIWGDIYSKCGLGVIPWSGSGITKSSYDYTDGKTTSTTTNLGRPITVEIYDLEDNLVTRSPVNLTHRPFTSYTVGDVRWDYASSTPYEEAYFEPKKVAFPWSYYDAPTPTGRESWGDTYPAPYNVDWFINGNNAVPNGVGPTQMWWTLAGATTPFRFQFGYEGWFGTPTGFSGMVPQTYATWTNGLLPGQYKVKGWTNGYVQTEDYIVTIPDAEVAGNAFIDGLEEGKLA
jgi:hypothetical protein